MEPSRLSLSLEAVGFIWAYGDGKTSGGPTLYVQDSELSVERYYLFGSSSTRGYAALESRVSGDIGLEEGLQRCWWQILYLRWGLRLSWD
jgi:hypothetical protein